VCGLLVGSSRIWCAPQKVSNDRRFDEKLIDVVGVYLNPPDKAVVLCMDEKSQIQALDRTQPSLPLKKGRAGTMTHDYKRNGTTTLFAALNVLTGVVIGQCLPRHRNGEFLKFLRTVDLQANNNDPKPFVWTATAEEILEKVSRGRVSLASIPANNETPH